MLKTLLFMLAVAGGCAASAQAPQPMPAQRDSSAEMTSAEQASAQKRMELRNVLAAGRKTEPPTQAGRQLSQQERAEMREQLRRFQPPGAARAQRP